MSPEDCDALAFDLAAGVPTVWVRSPADVEGAVARWLD